MIPAVLPTYNRAPLTFAKGQGAWLETEDGTRYLDLGAGIAVNALGHAAPELVEVLTQQAQRLWHVSNLYRIPEQERLARLLTQHTFADTCFFTNSGTEACELAVKMARHHWSQKDPKRTRILAFAGAFHGRSSAAIAAAGTEKMTKGFGPLLPGFTQLPWGDHDALRAAMAEPDVGAVMIEPVQGEGGIRPLPDQCLKGLRDLCDETGVLMIADEVQCGMGRTGRLFAHEWAGVTPDIMMVAKGIGGGFPIGAVLATEEAAASMSAGTHGSTYGGNPLGCAVAARVVEVMTGDGFLEGVRARGAHLHQGLQGLVSSHPDVFDSVRGLGLMWGLKCRIAPADLVQAGYAEHVLTVPAADNVVRLLPPLTITEAEIGEALARLDRAAARLSAA
ncbi:aspartate aminotransferase family protein [Wenxinia saemankumensis]|uniref:Acetylornithine aminotransferase n=1 Tax=Wenxinia saemankumensis TaxID=1447782 RepID=A0A1M6CBJ5_9RHOB|nr:aspartate aminotransferase family protein [Wenxinia saemankumensis]SHI58367.1 acetylornithine aminotransferase apoenzyme [Wenxinia saemankumensis]